MYYAAYTASLGDITTKTVESDTGGYDLSYKVREMAPARLLILATKYSRPRFKPHITQGCLPALRTRSLQKHGAPRNEKQQGGGGGAWF